MYGKSRVSIPNALVPPSCVGKSGIEVSVGCVPTLNNEHIDVEGVKKRMEDGVTGYRAWSHAFGSMGWRNIQKYYWSYKYQCLPTEVAFTGRSQCDVVFTSPINGMSLEKNDRHRSLERLVFALIEPWNECLIEGRVEWLERSEEAIGGWSPSGNERKQRGRVPCRIVTYGVEWKNEAPEWLRSFETVRRNRLKRYQKALANLESLKCEPPTDNCDEETRADYERRVAKATKSTKRYEDVEGLEQLPEPTEEFWRIAHEYLARAEPGSNHTVILPEDWRDNVDRLLSAKVRRMLIAKHPEPGTAFTYEQWRDGEHGGRAIVDMVTDRPILPRKAPPNTPHQPYNVQLQNSFREKGLQVIIRIDGIELSPENPEYTGGEWELKGMKNEHVVAVGVFSYDVENVSESRIAFRQETDVSPGFFRHGPNLFQTSSGYSSYKQPVQEKGKRDQAEAISEIFGFNAHQMCGDNHDFTLPFQEVGEVVLSQSRLIAFPNVMESRRMPFRLQDATRSGHHRWITVMLVDPHYRIYSTQDVLPREANWKGGLDDSRDVFHEYNAGRMLKEIEGETKRMNFARYTMMGTFFFS